VSRRRWNPALQCDDLTEFLSTTEFGGHTVERARRGAPRPLPSRKGRLRLAVGRGRNCLTGVSKSFCKSVGIGGSSTVPPELGDVSSFATVISSFFHESFESYEGTITGLPSAVTSSRRRLWPDYNQTPHSGKAKHVDNTRPTNSSKSPSIVILHGVIRTT
jgi:hypothetical protein